jgi:hypothetical protein
MADFSRYAQWAVTRDVGESEKRLQLRDAQKQFAAGLTQSFQRVQRQHKCKVSLGQLEQ